MDSMRKYSINLSTNDILDQLKHQLIQLHEHYSIHFNKKKKILIQLERKHNQLRRSIDRSNREQMTELVEQMNLIRQIKKKIIHEERHQQQQRRNEQQQVEHRHDHIVRLAITLTTTVFGLLTIATLTLMMLHSSQEYSM
jgi:hypothetical protein